MWAGVRTVDIPGVWPGVQLLVEKALRRTRGEMDARDVYVLLCSGRWQLWIFGPDKDRWGITVTQIYDLPQKKIAELVLLACRSGYPFHQLQEEALPILAAWAREQGCDALRSTTLRKGLKAAAALGWREIYVEMEYELWQRVAEDSNSPVSP
jgi:hypothetical protein